MKKSWFLVISLIGCASLIGAVLSDSYFLAKAKLELKNTADTVWGHYDALMPTFENPGCHEFYVSCQTHEISFSMPEEGIIEERGCPTVNDINSWKALKDGRYIEKIGSDFSLSYPSDGALINPNSDAVEEYISSYSKGCSAKYQGLGDLYQPKTTKLIWTSTLGIDTYSVNIATKADFSDCVTYGTISNYLDLNFLFRNTKYYWNVEGMKEGISYISPTYTFNVTEGPRCLDLKGVSNVRDLGGLKNLDGKRIKQGLVFRSAKYDGITSQGLEAAKYDLGIKTDIDLRNPSLVHSPLGEDVNLVKEAFPYWYDGSTGINKEANWPIIKDTMERFANINNYPIGFHCEIGQDRTGCVAIFLQSILNMSETLISRDYEMSSLSASAGDSKDGSGNIIKISDKWTYQVNPTFTYLKGFTGSTLAECTRTFLKEKCQISEATMQTIRDIMLED